MCEAYIHTVSLRAPGPDAVTGGGVLQPRRSPAAAVVLPALLNLNAAAAAPVLHLKPVTKLLRLLLPVAMASSMTTNLNVD
jgi:hypothetical protein